MNIKYFSVGRWVVLALVPIAAYWPITLVNQSFWDDDVMLSDYRLGTLWQFFAQMGRREQYWLVKPLVATGIPRVWIIAILLLSCLSVPLIYTIIRRVTRWSEADAFWAAILTALVPLNQARFFLSTLPYAFSSFFFLLSLVLLIHDLERGSSPFRRSLIVLLSIMAFSTNSFLTLSWIAPLITVWFGWRTGAGQPISKARLVETFKCLIQRSELLLLPFIYWAGKKLLEPTFGMYKQYNDFRMDPVQALSQTLEAFFKQFSDGWEVLIPRSSDFFGIAVMSCMSALIFLLVCRLWSIRLKSEKEPAATSNLITKLLLVFAALVLIIAALFPYVIVDQRPRFPGLWETRHQTTLMIVSGFALLASFRLIMPAWIRWAACALTAMIFLAFDLSFAKALLVDSLEVNQISRLFAAKPPAPGTMIFIIEDDREYRVFYRFLQFYELPRIINADVLAITNQAVIDPEIHDYARSVTAGVMRALTSACEVTAVHPEYGPRNFVSNGKIETIRLVGIEDPPSFFVAIKDALQPSKARPMVKLEIGPTATIEGGCASPCCK